MSDAVVLDGVTLAIAGRTILDAVSFAVPRGAFVAVLGPNGAGKTTLFKAVLGLGAPRSGRMEVLGRPPGSGTAIGYMPQTRSFPRAVRLGGRAFVASAVGGERFGLPLLGAAGRAEVERVLALAGATAFAARPIGELSGGERQRLLIAEALIGSPELLLLDEPLISLDARGQQETVELVSRLCRTLGLTVLFSAHEINPLLGAIDRVLYLGGGGAALGSVDEVITAPVLSALYRTPVEVVRIGARIFVMSGGQDLERQDHAHEDHGHDGHGHGDQGHAHGGPEDHVHTPGAVRAGGHR